MMSGAAAQRFFKLRQRLNFDLHLSSASSASTGSDRGGQRAGGGDVVFLDKHLVKQTRTVVLRPSAQNRIFLRCPQPRKRLPRVEDRALRSDNGVDVAAGGSRSRGQ